MLKCDWTQKNDGTPEAISYFKPIKATRRGISCNVHLKLTW